MESHLVLGLNEAQSYHRKNSMRDKVIGRTCVREKHSADRVWAIPEGESSTRIYDYQFLLGWVISQANGWEDYTSYFWRRNRGF